MAPKKSLGGFFLFIVSFFLFVLPKYADENSRPISPSQRKAQTGQTQGTGATSQPQGKPTARAAQPRGRSITLGDLTSFEVKDNVFSIAAGLDIVRIIFYRDDIFRLWLGPDGQFSEPPAKPEDAPIVVFSGAPIAVPWRDADDYYRLESKECVLRVYKKPLHFALFDRDDAAVIFQEDRPLTYGPTTFQSLRRGESEYFYGCGMQNGYFSHRDTSVNIRTNYGRWGDGTTPNPAPFYMSTAGYGAFRNTFAPGRYDFLSPFRLAHDEPRFDCYYFYGPSLKKILEGYTLISGRPFLPPRWGLEFGDSDCYNKKGKTPDVIQKVADVYRANDMPGGWILPNDGYGCGYVDLAYTVDELHKRGFYTGLWTEKGVDRIAEEVSKMGTRVMKLDVAWVGPGYQFALNGCRAAFEGIEKNSDGRGFIWSVGGWAGTQRYSTIWSGDQSGNWEYIRFHIPTVIGAGLSGFNCATGDVDGIFGGSALTQVRDLEWKCFTPVFMIISGWSKQTNLMKQPWIFGEPYTSINRRYLKLKMRLTPYIYSCCREAYEVGVPTVRAMVLEFPDDPMTWSKRTQYQFMSGKWLLVAPVYEDSPVRNDIYLPAGKWIDYWDGREYFGPSVVNGYETPLEKLPLLVRAGAIIPMYPEMLYDREKPKDPVTFDIYPFGKSSFTLYEDDGVTQEYRSGAFAKTLIEVDAPKSISPASSKDTRSESVSKEENRKAKSAPKAKKEESTLDNQIWVRIGPAVGKYKDMPQSRSYILDIHVPVRPTEVRLNDKALPSFGKREEFQAAVEGWFYDARDRRGVLHVKTRAISLALGFAVKSVF
jgi:alpha-glucosidase